MPTAFCERADVRRALQKVELSGSIGTEFIDDAIHGASTWFARATNGWWYDSGGTLGDDVGSSADSATNVRLDVPNSPHRTDRQLISDHTGARYPVTHSGPYAQILLPHIHVTSITRLAVRGHGGDTTDWVADSGFTEGRGEDYYAEAKGQDSYGRTYLYVNASSLPTVIDYENMLTVDYDYGLDWDSTEWADVRRGIANLAAAEVVDEDSVLAQIPDNGQLIGVQTQHENLTNAASNYLDPYTTSVPG